MNKFLIILLLITSCQKVEDEDTTFEQTKRIEKYLQSEGSVYTISDNLYKVMLTAEPDVPAKTLNKEIKMLERGDTVSIYFAQYTFKDKPLLIYNTNIEALAIDAGMQIIEDNLKPLDIIYGKSKILKGLEIGLKGSIEGDMFDLYMPSDLAYGAEENGVLPKHSTIKMYVGIDEIRKTKNN